MKKKTGCIMKNMFLLCLVAIILLSSISVFASSLMGDVDGNGVLDSNDLELLKGYSIGLNTLPNPQNADMNQDGKINTVDVAQLRLAIEQAKNAPSTPEVRDLRIDAPASINLQAGESTFFAVTFSGVGIDEIKVSTAGNGLYALITDSLWKAYPGECQAAVQVTASSDCSGGPVQFMLVNNTLGTIKSQNVLVNVVKPQPEPAQPEPIPEPTQPEVRDLQIYAPESVSVEAGKSTTFDVAFSGIGIDKIWISDTGSDLSTEIVSSNWQSSPCKATIRVSASKSSNGGPITFSLVNNTLGTIKSQNIAVKVTKETEKESTANTSDLKAASLARRYYSFVLKGTNLALDVLNGYDVNDGDVILYTSSNQNPAQLWEPVPVDGGVRFVAGCSSSRSLDIYCGYLTPRTRVQLYDWNGSYAQIWKVYKTSDGFYVLAAAADPSLVLTAKSQNLHAGVCLDTYTGSDLQKWSLASHAEKEKPVYMNTPVYSRENLSQQIGVFPTGRNVWPHSHVWDGKQLVVGVTSDNKEVIGWIDARAFDRSAQENTNKKEALAISSINVSATRLSYGGGTTVTAAYKGGTAPYRVTYRVYDAKGAEFSSIPFGSLKTQSVSHHLVFNTAGSFVVKVTVQDAEGKTVTKSSKTITVAPQNNNTTALKAASLSQRYYSFVLKGTSLALDVKNGVDANAAEIILYQSSNGNKAQLFEPITTNGKVRLVAGCSANRVLDVLNRNLVPKADVQLYDWNDTPAQHWVFKQDSKGYYVIQLAENPNLVLTAVSNRSGAEVRLDTYTGSDLQKWSVKNYAENPRPVYKDVTVYDRTNRTTKIGTIPAGRNVWPHSHVWDGKQLVVGVTSNNKEVVGWIDVSALKENVVGTANLPKDIAVTQAGSRTCTLAATTMMLRARAYLDGQGYSHITERAMKPTAWIEGQGLRLDFWYNGKYVLCKNINRLSLHEKKQELIDQLRSHPEGIVIWDDQKPHAVHLTHYKDGSFYVNDPANGRFSVKLETCATMGGNGQDGKLARIYQFWYIAS